jgi:DNA polymerase III epsilon subunit-like protein
MSHHVCFIDCETTGLDPTRHVPWEIGLIIGEEEFSFELDLTVEELSLADPMALKIGCYYERAGRMTKAISDDPGPLIHVLGREDFALYLVKLIGTRHLVGAVPSFDDRFIGDFVRRCGYPPVWHYHLVDVEALAAGAVAQPPPWDSEDLSRRLGVDPDQFDRHTALGDARWAKALYERVIYGQLDRRAS